MIQTTLEIMTSQNYRLYLLVPSDEADTKKFRSGLKLTALTDIPWPSKVLKSEPERSSIILSSTSSMGKDFKKLRLSNIFRQ